MAHIHGADAHGHDHGRGGGTRAVNQRRLVGVLCLALGYAGVELVGGYLTGSLALLADSVHMLSDVAALGISAMAVWMASRPASGRRTFGNSRAEILAALANGLALGVVAVFITVHAIERFLAPTEVEGQGVMWIATGGLVVNLIALAILEHGRSESLNVRGAFLHVLSDTLASVGVIAAGAGIWAFGWLWLDPAISLGVSALVLASAWHLVREALDVLMEMAPSHLHPERIHDAMVTLDGVRSVHCLHVWTIGSGEVSLSSHLVVDAALDPEALLARVRGELAERFAIEHTTIQIEPVAAAGDAPACGEEICEPGRAALA